MTNKVDHVIKMRILPGLLAIATFCIALPVRAALPYPTASTVSQFEADCSYANTAGGAFTIYLQPNTGFTNAGVGIGGTKTVSLTIIGNGDTFDNLALSRFFIVAAGSSLTLEQMSLEYGEVGLGPAGAIANEGTLTISNCTLLGNSCTSSDYSTPLPGPGGAIDNSGTLIIENSIFTGNSATGDTGYLIQGGAIYNTGTVTISNSTFKNNYCYNTTFATFDGSGGAIWNSGTVTVENSSRISENWPDDVANDGTVYLDSSSEIGILDGNPAIIVRGSGPPPSPRISLTTSNAVVISWPYPSTGWSLQQNSDSTTANWVTSTNAVANDGTNNFVTTSPSPGKLFFRLEF